MTVRARHIIGALILGLGLGVLPPPTALAQQYQGWVPHRAEFAFVRMQHRNMEEDGGPEPLEENKHYRVSSRRFLVSGTYRLADRYAITPVLGLSDLELHASEGETREFDPAVTVGVGGEARIGRIPRTRLDTAVFARLLYFEVTDGDVSYVAQDEEFRSWDEVDVAWLEFELGARADLETDFGWLYGGFRYNTVNADADGTFRGSGDSETLEPDDEFGLFSGIRVPVHHPFWVRGQVNFLDETAFTLAVGADIW